MATCLTVSGHLHHKQSIFGSQGDPLPICTEKSCGVRLVSQRSAVLSGHGNLPSTAADSVVLMMGSEAS